MTLITSPTEPSVVTPASPESGSPLRLSEAIRLGAMTTDQAFGTLVDERGAMCAEGAAIAALGGDPHSDDLSVVLDRRADVPMPDGCSHRLPSLQPAIHHLNDYHRMPRHEIADWLAGMGL
jgi:hypothetical protein